MVDYSGMSGWGTAPASVGSGLTSIGNIVAGDQPIQFPFDPASIDFGIPKIPMPGHEVNSGFGSTLDKANLALSGLGTIGTLWAAFQAQKLAKQQFAFTKRITETNLANQIKSYNTTLEDRGRSRAAVEGQTADQAQAYIDHNRLSNGV